MAEQTVTMIIGPPPTPEERAERFARMEQAKRNDDWFSAHAVEIGNQYRGKLICVAGEELFVGDSVAEVLGKADEAHPNDYGKLVQYVPLRKTLRIYDNRRILGRRC